jgi:hypothetical protein
MISFHDLADAAIGRLKNPSRANPTPLALADGLVPDRNGRIRGQVIAYARRRQSTNGRRCCSKPILRILRSCWLIYNCGADTQMLVINLFSAASAVAFFVILAHDRPFVGVISVSPKPLLQLAAKAGPEIPVAIGMQP